MVRLGTVGTVASADIVLSLTPLGEGQGAGPEHGYARCGAPGGRHLRVSLPVSTWYTDIVRLSRALYGEVRGRTQDERASQPREPRELRTTMATDASGQPRAPLTRER